ncbi:MAG TPA: CocE/NonD family hydrolase, partial [Labilithrix sp.]
DICLPRGLAGERVPTIVRQTRYFRRFRVHPALRRALPPSLLDPMNAPMRELFTSRGYAWVDVDVRGSGASFGERPTPWYLEGEVEDGREIADFIVKQPWSNGLIGSTGVSYDGTTAEFLGTLRHPAVRAVAPRFSLFDVFTDIAFPGGLHNAYFTESWERANGALDRNAPGEMVGLLYSIEARGLAEPGSRRDRALRVVDRPGAQAALRAVFNHALAGVAPVDDDARERVLAEALRSHAQNWNVHTGAVHMTFRDDSPPNAPLPGHTSEDFSPHTYADRLDGVAVLSYGGLFDGGYGGAVVKRHRRIAGSELLLGPWAHGGALDMDPDVRNKAAFDHATELLRFFDAHLGRAREDRPRVRWYLMGEGAWRSGSKWPPDGTRAQSLHLAADRKLARTPSEGIDVYESDPRGGSGVRTRWRTLLCPFLRADGKGRHGATIAYETEPFDADTDVVGRPVLVLRVATSPGDCAIFAYVEEIDREGDARVVTEGCLRTLHRTTLDETVDPPRVVASFLRKDAIALGEGESRVHAIELLPMALRVRRGHRLRLVLAGADVDHFTTPSGDARVTWRIDRAGSRLIVPVAP